MSNISIISKTTHQVLQTVDTNTVKQISLTENSALIINIPKDDVAKITREGNSAVITLRNGETIVIQNYFNDDNTADNSLAFVDDNGQMYWAQFTDANGVVSDTIKYHLIDDVEPLLYQNDNFAGLLLPWLGGAAAIGAIAAVAANNDDDDNNNNNGGNPSKPNIPTVTQNNGDGMGGKGDPGTTVIITDSDGNTVTAIVDPNGDWKIDEPPLKEGEQGTIQAEKPDGTKSDEGPVVGGDQTDPAIPDIDPVNLNDPITGTGEPGSKITVTFPDGKTATAQVDQDGKWTVENPKDLKDGDEIKAIAEDPAGNKSGEATEIVDGVPPLKPVIDEVAEGDTEITGSASPDTVYVTVTFKDHPTVTAIVDADGKWSVPNPGVKDGDVIKANATDLARNTSDNTELTVAFASETDPLLDAPKAEDDVGLVKGDIANNSVTDDNLPKFTGTNAIPNAVVKVYAGNDVIGSTTAKADGTWELTPPTALKDGKYDFTATQTVAGQKESPKSPVLSFDVDTVKPEVPTLDTIYDDAANPSEYGAKDQNILEGDKFSTESGGVKTYYTNDTKPTFGGTGEIGATVTVMYNDGSQNKVLGTAIVQADGRWTVTNADMNLDNRSYKITAYQTDSAGNVSDTSADLSLQVSTKLDFNFTTYGADQFGIDGATFAIGTEKSYVPQTIVVDSIKIYGEKGVTDTASSIHVLDKDGKVVEGVKWTFDPANPHIVKMELPTGFKGAYTVSVPAGSFYDYAGNYNANYQFKNNPVAPLNFSSDVEANKTSFYNGDTTNDSTPIIPLLATGIKGDISTVYIQDETGKITTVDVTGSANTQYQFKDAFSEGDHSLSFSYVYKNQYDKEIQSPWSNPFKFTVDTKTFVSTATSDTFTTTGTDFDSVIYNLLNDSHATGGNTNLGGIAGADRWTDFELNADASAVNKDTIDISKLLSDDVTNANVKDYIKLSHITGDDNRVDTVISIDRDAAGDKYTSTELLVLQNVNTTIDDLLANKQLLF